MRMPVFRQPLLHVCDVAIVGGGFSGAAVAAQLARRAPNEFSLALFEPNELGRGAAYGTSHDAHVLNTRAGAMNLFPEQPDHFVRWLGARAKPDDFVSRRLYGAYVNQLARRAFERPNFLHVTDRAVQVRRRDGDHHYVVESDGGAQFAARAVVLATGNPPPGDTFCRAGSVCIPATSPTRGASTIAKSAATCSLSGRA